MATMGSGSEPAMGQLGATAMSQAKAKSGDNIKIADSQFTAVFMVGPPGPSAFFF
ncbi:hypothetical protein [Nitrospirillum sp. BR 11828]|uniref:hypothetical protein n=1 Tax=Nitrospirillum sp. BR 11828 TaxID=3104325 RepID=UPI002ACA705A|nr:hypothetical protein [Nitrospirillum sp. BR 11828]MDZ5647398.1 hypothetical protein [Nitrospirillum sp. BR 11828]